MVCMQPDSTFKYEESEMTTTILSLEHHIPAPLNIDRLNMWSAWLSNHTLSPKWISETIDLTLGLERCIDILWLAVMLPQLSVHDNKTPTWMANVVHLSGLYKNGIDLLDSQTIRNLDVSDVKALFPDLMNSGEHSLIQDLLLTYQAYISFRKHNGHPAMALSHADWGQRWIDSWTQYFETPPIHFFDLLPSVTVLRQHHHLSSVYTPKHITPTAMQVLWSSGLLDSAIDTEAEEDRMVEDLCNAAKDAVKRFHAQTGLSESTIILRLHAFFETKLTNEQEALRTWIWGHSPCLVGDL